MSLRYFREATSSVHSDTQFVWDDWNNRGVWVTFDGRFNSHSTYDLDYFMKYLRDGKWIETDAAGNRIPVPEIEKEKAEAKAKAEEEARAKAEEAAKATKIIDSAAARYAISNELGANVFGRLLSIERALESRNWASARTQLTDLLSFIPEPEPEYVYYRSPINRRSYKGRRIDQAGRIEVFDPSTNRWTVSAYRSYEHLKSQETPVPVSSEADIHKE